MHRNSQRKFINYHIVGTCTLHSEVPCIIRPHRSTTYVDVAYCYRPSSVVCRSVTLVSPAKMAELIEMPFGLRTRVGPGNHVLDGSPDPPWEGAILGAQSGVQL